MCLPRRMRWAIMVGLSSLMAGCACGESEPRAGAGDAQAVTEQTPRPTASGSDGEASVSRGAEEGGPPESPGAEGPIDCDALVTNADGLDEAHCKSERAKLRAVNKDSTLTLDEVSVRSRGVSYAEALVGRDIALGAQVPYGRFVIVTVTVTNRGGSSMSLRENAYEMFALLLAQSSSRTRIYTADFQAMSAPGPSLMWGPDARELRPGEASTGTLVFDVPEEQVDLVEKSGSLSVLQPSDVWRAEGPKKRRGLIRLHS